MAKLDLTKLITHYAHFNKADNKSAKTVTWYSEMLEDYVKLIQSTRRESILVELNAETVREVILHEQSRNLSPFTIQGKVRALKFAVTASAPDPIRIMFANTMQPL